MGTRGQWALDFLRALGNSSPDQRTQNLVAAWTVGEDTEAKYNPLATTLKYGSYTKFNNCCGGNGVKNYSSRDEGIQATVLTLQGNHSGYSDIVRGLQTNDPERALKGMLKNVWGTNFTHVASVWASRDARKEELKSESPSPPKIYVGGRGHPGEKGDAETTLPNPNPANKPSQVDPNYVSPTGGEGVTASGVQNAFKMVLGVGLLGTAVVLVIVIAMRTDAAKAAVSIASKGVV